jgi:nucleotide-binding universal stress UspA family protein
MFDTIVVGHDGSKFGDLALAAGRSLAHAGSHLVVVHIVQFLGGKGGTFPFAINEDEIQATIAEEVARLRTEDIDAMLLIREDALNGPAHVIADVAHSVDADLIVVGSRGRSLPAELILGGVPVRLLHIARRPVLVVPAP